MNNVNLEAVEKLLKNKYPFRVFEICKIAGVKRHVVYMLADALGINVKGRGRNPKKSNFEMIKEKIKLMPNIVEVVKDCVTLRYPKSRFFKECQKDFKQIYKYLTATKEEIMYIFDTFINKSEKKRFREYQYKKNKR